MPQLQRFQVSNLFGQFNHTIDFNTKERITAILAPNGLGKTVCLKLIAALFSQKMSAFRGTDFDSVLFKFTTGEEVEIGKKADQHEDDSSSVDGPSDARLQITFKNSHGKVKKWSAKAPVTSAANFELISRYIPQVTRRSKETWTVDATGEPLSIDELIERYPRQLARAGIAFHSGGGEEYDSLLKSVHCHLIETNRLLSPTKLSETGAFYPGNYRHQEEREFSVEVKAKKLTEILRTTLTDYANLSQQLDRSFPRRAIANQGSQDLEQAEIQHQIELLDKRRTALAEAGILDTSLESVAIPTSQLELGVIRMLQTYVQDTKKKLDFFDDILNKIILFKELINSRFLNKSLEVDQKKGYVVKSHASKREIPLSKLSSGEQHRLVMLFELLFEVPPNSLILIDEPELSLHVSWQHSFLEELKSIINLNNFDVVLATHSPTLIGRQYNLAVELMSVE